MSTQLVEFPPVDCNAVDAEDVLRSLHTFAQEAQVKAVLQVGHVAVVIRPDEDSDLMCARYQRWVHQYEIEGPHGSKPVEDTLSWISERRQGGDRRQWQRDDGRERRTSKLPPLPE